MSQTRKHSTAVERMGALRRHLLEDRTVTMYGAGTRSCGCAPLCH
jgi:hypothetical protein